ncbi:MAG: protein translocase subunit SecD [Spirochaetia bacterium]|nr:protein translocase subunit SecD [Spirochaetia bacterium]
MNTRSRLITISLILFLSVLLVWPNFGERIVKVYFLPGLSDVELQENLGVVKKYLTEHYPDYKSEKKTSKSKEDKDETYLEIKGSFVQAAFLNEISRLNGVDSERVILEKMWIEKSFMAKPFKLGLDLQGGMNLVLEADFKKLQNQIESRYSADYIKNLKENIEKAKNKNEKSKFESELQFIEDEKNLSPQKKKERVSQALEKIRSRIDKTGVSEPLIRIQGVDKIEVSLPGVSSPEHAKKIIASTARVEYRLAEPRAGGGVGEYTRKAMDYFDEYVKLESEAAKADLLKKIKIETGLPENFEISIYWKKRVVEAQSVLTPSHFMVLERQVALDGDAIANAYVSFNQDRLENEVSFILTPEGSKVFADITTKNKGREMAIIIDEKIRSAPTINEPITGGSAVINGSFTAQEAKDLALIIKEGALPVPMKIVEERSVGPSLGKESTKNGLEAILLGLLAVTVFMLVYYHTAGIIAVIALVLNLLFMSAILALMDFTITLPGLAGVVLTLGMVVDANVIIYERIKEEINRGKNLKLAVTQGFDRATWTILDSNLTTMLAAIVLSQFGVGPIKGFAVTLFIGILSSLFTSLFVSKTLFYLMVYDMNVKTLHLGFGKHQKSQSEKNRTQVKEAVE